MSRSDQGCGGHAGLPGELRAVVLLALERIGPLLERVATEPSTGPSSCVNCPVCAVLAALRGERPELAVRLAEQASGLIEVLRAALDEGNPGAPPPPPGPPAAPTRTVQYIRIDRRTATRERAGSRGDRC